MNSNIESFEKLVNAFAHFPSVGRKTAQRYAYHILTMSDAEARELSNAIMQAKNNVHFCSICGNYTEDKICKICSTRSPEIICVVKEPKDVLAFEKVREYSGQYHILHGCLSPLDNRGPDDIRIKELIARISQGQTNEVIMATNPDVEGEATALYISKLLKPFGVKVTRLAQGISMGSDIEYADEVTLSKALHDRKEI